jgi:hypothetical protein
MIDGRDTIELVPGVALRGGSLIDPVRGAAIPLNRSAELVLTAPTIAAAGRALDRSGASNGTVDALAFCARLNALALLNVQIRLRERARRRLVAFRYGIVLHAPVRRVHVPGPVAVARVVAAPAALLTLALLPATVIAGSAAVAVAFITGAGVVLHEVGHALALRGTSYALVLDGLRPALLHRRLHGWRAVAVASAGPLAPALVALAVALTFRQAAPVLAPLAAHSLGLSILTQDGRNACGLS